MAGAGATIDVGVDVGNPAAIDKLFSNIDARLQNVLTQATKIVNSTKSIAADFDKQLAGSLGTLAKMEQKISSLEKMAQNAARAPINSTLDAKNFGQKVRAATDFSKSLDQAKNNADALQVRLNRLTETIARQGKMSPGQLQRMESWEREKNQVARLDAQYAKLGERAASTGKDFTALTNKVEAANAKLQAALQNPRRVNFGTEINGVQAAQAQLQAAIAAQSRLGGGGGGNGPQLFGATGLKGIFARTLAYGGAASVGFGALNVGRESLQFVVDYEAALKQLQAISGATNTQLGEMDASIQKIGESSKFSLVDLTKMATILAQAGVSSGQMQDVLKAVNNMAVASGSTADEAAQLITSAIGAFQLQASEAGRVADLMTEALNRTKLNVQQIGQAIQYVGATAFEENIPLEKVLATIGALAQAGIKSGSTIGTGFRQFLVDLENPTDKMVKGLERFGLKQKDIDVSTRGLTAVIKTLADAGIGSSQAFQMMERRGAAFYLVAKNNLDVVDQLQISFAHQNAAQEANAEAMDSVASQWQRFKNLQGAQMWKDLETPMTVVKNLLKEINGEMDKGGGIAGQPQWMKSLNDWITGPAHEATKDFLEGFANFITTGSTGDANGLGTMIRNLAHNESEAADNAEKLKTAVSKAGEAVDEKKQKVDGLNKELERLYTQEEGIKSTTNGVAAETASLSSRFEGLAKYLVDSKGKFEDLTDAMKALKREEMGLLAGDYMNQAIQLHQQRLNSANQAASLRGSLANVDLSKLGFSQAEANAVRQPGIGNYANNAQLILDATDRLARKDAGNPWIETLRKLGATMLDAISQGVQEQQARNQSFNAKFSATPRGQQLEGTLSAQNANISKMEAEDYATRQKLGKGIESVLDTMIQSINNQLGKVKDPELIKYLNSVKNAAIEARKSAEGTMKMTDEEIKQQKERERAARQAENAADRANRALKLSDVDAIGLHFGAQLGSGRRSYGEQLALYNAGKTRARPEVDGHVQDRARDFKFPGMDYAGLKRMADAMQALANRMYGAGVMFFKAESGQGAGQGTGPHVHGQINRNAKMKKKNFIDDPQEALQQAVEQTQLGTDAMDVRNAARLLQNDLDGMRGQLDQAIVMQGAEQASKDATAWYEAVKKQIIDQAATRGLTADDPEVKDQLAAAYDAYVDKMRELNKSIGDAVFSNFEKQLNHSIDAIQKEFDKTIAPYENRTALAGAVVQGFGYESNRNKIPDYVQFLAQQKEGQAKESQDRATVVALTQQISELQAQLSQSEFDSILIGIVGTPDQIATAQSDLEALRLKITQLSGQRDALNAGLNAGQQAPNSISEGFSKAAQAYSAIHGLNQSLTEFVNSNWTSVLEQLDTGFSTFFMDIISGSKSVKSAFKDFVGSMIKMIEQLIAKFLAMQVLKMIFSLFGGAAPGGIDPAMVMGGTFTGGPATKGSYRGEYLKGNPGRDSMLRRVAGGEYIVRKHAVDSVGEDFMHDLNNKGRGALKPQAIPMPAMAPQVTNVYVVRPEDKQQLGPNDVLVIWQDDVLKNGQTKKLIKQVARGA